MGLLTEGKGVIAGHLARHFDAAVRVGGPNAGHSLYDAHVLYKMRSVPCAWVNPDCQLFIGAGSVVNGMVLQDELEELPGRVEVTLDPMAAMVREEYEHRELETIRLAIGSTAEGVGEARIARIRRDGSALLAGSPDVAWDSRVSIESVSPLLDDLLGGGAQVMLEGTQGSGLSLFHGTQYPFVTSSDTNASGIAAEAGIAPSDVGHVHLVVRFYPIRVAGNSGPMGDELTWEYFIEEGIVARPEQTTVTKKTRRIAHFRPGEVRAAIRLNRPCAVWPTFGDYLDPGIRGRTSLSPVVMQRVRDFESDFDVPVLGVGTGPVKEGDLEVDFAVARLQRMCSHGRSW